MVSRTTKLEQFFIISLGYLIFELLFIRIGFIFGLTINTYTLPFSWMLYLGLIGLIYSLLRQKIKKDLSIFIPLVGFIGIMFLFYGISFLLSYTYDTSWDGQGYNQTAVIALTKGWDPARSPNIDLGMELPSQIFAEGYPSALWELQASVYAFVGRINAAKILQVIIGVLAGISVFSLFRKLLLGKWFSILLSNLVVLQPIYLIQLLTFMQDGFGYQLLVIAVATLVIYILDTKSYWAMSGFVFAEILLVSTKYSQLPIALALGVIFALLVGNRLLNREYLFDRRIIPYIFGFVIVMGIFAFVPYGKNLLFHGTPFYPVNIPELMGSVRFNNIPPQLRETDKGRLLLYGIFSESQSLASGDPRSPANVANLKVPFTFTLQELREGAMIYNNRVGAGGVLYSGVVFLSIILLIYSSFIVNSRNERYAVYISYFGLVAAVVVSLFAPTPNLLRYVNQLQLIPFIVMIPIFISLRNKWITVLSYAIIMSVVINLALFAGAVIHKVMFEQGQINAQLAVMHNSGNRYNVRAQHFYSNYVLLSEQDVPYVAVKNIHCEEWEYLWASSTTTQYCVQ